jgi:hypothetical protein
MSDRMNTLEGVIFGRLPCEFRTRRGTLREHQAAVGDECSIGARPVRRYASREGLVEFRRRRRSAAKDARQMEPILLPRKMPVRLPALAGRASIQR